MKRILTCIILAIGIWFLVFRMLNPTLTDTESFLLNWPIILLLALLVFLYIKFFK